MGHCSQQSMSAGRCAWSSPHQECIFMSLMPLLPDIEHMCTIIRYQEILMILWCVSVIMVFLDQMTKWTLVYLQGPNGHCIKRCFSQDGGQAYSQGHAETWMPRQSTSQPRILMAGWWSATVIVMGECAFLRRLWCAFRGCFWFWHSQISTDVPWNRLDWGLQPCFEMYMCICSKL